MQGKATLAQAETCITRQSHLGTSRDAYLGHAVAWQTKTPLRMEAPFRTVLLGYATYVTHIHMHTCASELLHLRDGSLELGFALGRGES